MSATVEAPVESTDEESVAPDDPRILALGIEPPRSVAAVFRNFDRIKDLLRAEAAEGDRLARVTPLAGRAMRSSGFFQLTYPKARGGLETSFQDHLELVMQVSRIDAGTGWTVAILNASGHHSSRLSDEAYAELYPSVDTPVTNSWFPPAKVTRVEGGYEIKEGRWDWGSGGYQADMFSGGALVFEPDGSPSIDEEGRQRLVSLWFPRDKTEQAHNWDPMGLRASGSSSYYITEPLFIPERYTMSRYAPDRPDDPPMYKHLSNTYYPILGVAAGIAQHMIDLTVDAVRAKLRGGKLGEETHTALSDAMGECDMMVMGLRHWAQEGQRLIETPDNLMSPAQVESMLTMGIRAQQATGRVLDLLLDVHGSAFIQPGSEMGRAIRDYYTMRAHSQFKHSNMFLYTGRVAAKLADPDAVISPLDEPWVVYTQ
ncbi:hypothetical protein [Nocardioides sp. GXZ039]|uniref:hypothetical protein n=1 Tax=Nocardioides sp. GXZ039 TaxID=3136018 RepID=UPI0030F4A52E